MSVYHAALAGRVQRYSPIYYPDSHANSALAPADSPLGCLWLACSSVYGPSLSRPRGSNVLHLCPASSLLAARFLLVAPKYAYVGVYRYRYIQKCVSSFLRIQRSSAEPPYVAGISDDIASSLRGIIRSILIREDYRSRIFARPKARFTLDKSAGTFIVCLLRDTGVMDKRGTVSSGNFARDVRRGRKFLNRGMDHELVIPFRASRTNDSYLEALTNWTCNGTRRLEFQR